MAELVKHVSKGKDGSCDHADYEAAMELRDTLHNEFVDHDYRKGYVSMDESAGEDHKPVQTHRVSYRSIDGKKPDAEVTQHFKDHKGSGQTHLKFHEMPKKAGPAVDLG